MHRLVRRPTPVRWVLLAVSLTSLHCGDPGREDFGKEVYEDTDTDTDAGPDGDTDTDCTGPEEPYNGIDDDCDPTTLDDDLDGDGHGIADDCDDTDAAVHPGADEVCDDGAVDNDCDGLVDQEDDSLVGGVELTPDRDGDGFGDRRAAPEARCEPGDGFVEDATDCDDTSASVYPGSTEASGAALEDTDCDGWVEGSSLGADYRIKDVFDRRSAGIGLQFDAGGDIDGDGLADLVVASSRNATDATQAGSIHVFLGASLASRTDPTVFLDESDFQILFPVGSGPGGVRFIGDVDQDGRDDIAYRTAAADGTIGVSVYLGGSVVTSPRWTLSAAASDRFISGPGHDLRASGYDFRSVAGSDLDGDGHPELLIACSNELHVMDGSLVAGSASRDVSLDEAAFHIVGETVTDSLATAFDASGDIDADGLPDLFISAPYDRDAGETWSGTVFGFLGSSLAARAGSTLSTADADLWLVGEANSDLIGEMREMVGFAGDVDGDGRDDLLVGSFRSDQAEEDAGKMYLVLGSSLDGASGSISISTADYGFLGTDANGNMARSVAGLDDVDGDGSADLLVSSRVHNRTLLDSGGDLLVGAGALYVVRGSSVTGRTARTRSIEEADATVRGAGTQEYLGWATRNGGDIDGDGRSDIVAGSIQDPESSGTGSGVVSVFLSRL